MPIHSVLDPETVSDTCPGLADGSGHSHLSVTATSEVEVGSPKRPGQAPDAPWEEAAEVLCHDLDPERLEARQFLLDSPLCEPAADITRYAAISLRPGDWSWT